jgi:hypothetical protein
MLVKFLFAIKNNESGGHVLNINLCLPHVNAGIVTCRPHPLPSVSPVKLHGESPLGGGVQYDCQIFHLFL